MFVKGYACFSRTGVLLFGQMPQECADLRQNAVCTEHSQCGEDDQKYVSHGCLHGAVCSTVSICGGEMRGEFPFERHLIFS